MLELEEALSRILNAVPPAVAERVPLNQAHGRVLAETPLARSDLPPFDNSSMDGYAVRAEDVAGAREPAPVRLRIIGRIPAGQIFAGTIEPGTCARLFTGSALPEGANAVVAQEETRTLQNDENAVLVLEPVKPWENVRLAGEDVKRGAVLANPGEILTSGLLSLLGASGLSELSVGRQPRVGLLATGSELREPGETLEHGQIFESNRIGLSALAQAAGAIPQVYPLVPDALAGTRAALERAFAECDLVITSGGVSVGEMDFVKEAFTRAGGHLDFWKISIKPGRPFAFGRLDQKLLFGLPGNPVSAFVSFLLLARPALLRWQGAAMPGLPSSPGVLAEPIGNSGTRRHFLRVFMDCQGRVFSAGFQASHALSSLARANGLLDLPPQTSLEAGTTVQVLRWG